MPVRAQPRLAVQNSDAIALALQKMDHDAEIQTKSFRPVRGPDGRLQPLITLPGDTLETTPMMKAMVAAFTIQNVALIAWEFHCSTNLFWPTIGAALGVLAGELFSGTFHWATDNYGELKTPLVGQFCAAFQGHHLAPWTISHRSLWNNVWKIARVGIPIVGFGALTLPPSGAIFLAVMVYCQLLAQEFHRWTHGPPKFLPAWKRKLQEVNIALPFSEHIAHHKPPFDKHYCILTGQLNGLLDSEPVLFWRRLEALVYRINGQEPNSWKDPKVKQLALSTWPTTLSEAALHFQKIFKNVLRRVPRLRAQKHGGDRSVADDKAAVQCFDQKFLVHPDSLVDSSARVLDQESTTQVHATTNL
jgi:ubiquitin-conjugating enzyme E2 variant